METWLDVKGTNGHYQISSLGRVRSVDRIVETKRGLWEYKGKVLSPSVGTNGYYGLMLRVYFTNKSVMIHRLVAEAFIYKPIDSLEVDHIDNNKLNNAVSNLRWISHFDNASRANKGICRKSNVMEKNPRAKKVYCEDGKIYDCAKKISIEYNINYSTLREKLRENRLIINNIKYSYNAT